MRCLIAILILVLFARGVGADQVDVTRTQEGWQLKKAYQSDSIFSGVQLAVEATGGANLYEGLTDVQIHKAMDALFDRIDMLPLPPIMVVDALSAEDEAADCV